MAHFSQQAKHILITAALRRDVTWFTPQEIVRWANLKASNPNVLRSSVGQTVCDLAQRGLLERNRAGTYYRLTEAGKVKAQQLMREDRTPRGLFDAMELIAGVEAGKIPCSMNRALAS